MVEVNNTVKSHATIRAAAKPAAAAAPKASTKATAQPVQESRLEQQQRYFSNMWTQFGRDARLAAIMLNPLFTIQAQSIAYAATGEAIRRYETEVPQKDFSVLLAEENARARTAILNLPHLYQERGKAVLNATGDALLHAYDATSDAVSSAYHATADAVTSAAQVTVGAVSEAYDSTADAVSTAADATATAVSDAADATGRVVTQGAVAVKKGFFATIFGTLHGFGSFLSGIGRFFTGAGSSMESVGR